MIKKVLLLLTLAISFDILVYFSFELFHLFTTGLNPFMGYIAILIALLIGMPIIVFVVKKLIRYCRGRIRFTPAILFELAFLIFLTGYVFTEIFFGHSTTDIQLHDTYFVIANAHITIFLALLSLVFSAVYNFYPSIAGRVLNAPMGYIHFGITLIGFCVLGWPAHNEELAGMPRRYLDYSNWGNANVYGAMIPFKTKVIILLIGAQLLFIINLIYSAVKGKRRAI
jgi:cytochrome c oxidase subunit I